MSDKNWTPGPWSIEPAWDARCGGSVAIINRDHPRDDWDVCEVHSTEANAHLIRTAPELYEALDAAMTFIESHVADPDITGEMARNYAALMATNPRAVLAKARGAQ